MNRPLFAKAPLVARDIYQWYPPLISLFWMSIPFLKVLLVSLNIFYVDKNKMSINKIVTGI